MQHIAKKIWVNKHTWKSLDRISHDDYKKCFLVIWSLYKYPSNKIKILNNKNIDAYKTTRIKTLAHYNECSKRIDYPSAVRGCFHNAAKFPIAGAVRGQTIVTR